MKKKKIIATIGPSSFNKYTIQKMDISGVDYFRINLSHVDIDNYTVMVKQLMLWTEKSICLDTEGAQLRTSLIQNRKIDLYKNDTIKLCGPQRKEKYGKGYLPLNYNTAILKIGDLLKIDFNSVIVQIIDIGVDYAIARVIRGGFAGSNKGVSVDRKIKLPSLTVKDKKALKISNELAIKTIFISFCSEENIIKTVRKYFNYEIEIISKIENEEGLINLESISRTSDAILIDRGDLSRVVPMKKIPFAQKYILQKKTEYGVPAYVATNLLENMILAPEPTRAEVNDIVKSLDDGADGLVLAGETAIGSYPIETVRILSQIINENEKNTPIKTESIDYLFTEMNSHINKPYGGSLVQQFLFNKSQEYKEYQSIIINQDIESDSILIGEGVYSPLTGFMDLDEIKSVLYENRLKTGIYWSMPIIFQIEKEIANQLTDGDDILLKCYRMNREVGLMKNIIIEKISSMQELAKLWFGTDEIKHPGVKKFYTKGKYIISGDIVLFKNDKQYYNTAYSLTPKQTRSIFSQNYWQKIIGFHTRNIPHSGHEYIQKKAIELINADAIFISPVTGSKKSGDFISDVVIGAYNILIKKGIYHPAEAILGVFNTYSRFCGPREAIFTAMCRKNYGCTHFIVGRDHTGIGDYYSNYNLKRLFDKIDLGIDVLVFDPVFYCDERNIVTSETSNKIPKGKNIPINATKIRDLLIKGKKIPDYYINPILNGYITKLSKEDINKVLI